MQKSLVLVGMTFILSLLVIPVVVLAQVVAVPMAPSEHPPSLVVSGNIPQTNTLTALKCDLTFNYQVESLLPGTVNYTAVVTNNGNGTCRNTSLSFYYAENEKFISSFPKPTAADYYWYIGSLNSGKSFAIEFTTLYSLSSLHNEGCASASNGTDSCFNYDGDITQMNNPPSPQPLPTSQPQNEPVREFGVWFWDSPMIMTSASAIYALDAVKAKGVNAVYITVDDYLEINALPLGRDRDVAILAYGNAVSKFISLAESRGIAVDAVAGARDWVNADKVDNASIILKFVSDYNVSHSNKFRGVQYDVEPYLLPDYESNKAAVLLRFTKLVDGLVKQNMSYGLKLGFVIPHFYDSVNKWTPSFTFNGKNSYAFTHLLNILDRSPNSTLLVMAYRNTATGSDSATSVSRDEVKEASVGHNTKVIVAQEVGDVEPSYVTFYGKSYSYFSSQLSIIQDTFVPYGSFSGVAVNYLDPFLKLMGK
jgi:hypothetical protein